MSYKDEIRKIKNNEIQNVYLIYGEEEFLIQKFIKLVKEKLVLPNFEDLNFINMDNKDFTIDKFIDACETLPFMAERKLVMVRGLEVFRSKKRGISEEDEKQLIDYIKKIPTSTCLLFYGNKTVDARKKIVKEIQKYGRSINFEKLSAKDLRQWIDETIKKYGKTIGSKEMEYFMGNIDYIGRDTNQNLLDIDKEIQKLIAYIGDRDKIEEKDLENIFSSNFQNDIFKLLDAIGKKQVGEGLKRLDFMLNQGEAIIKISVTLGNQLRNLYKTKLLLEEGYTSKTIASKIGIHPYVASKTVSQCRDFSLGTLENLLNKYLQMDVAMKSGKIQNTIAMELFIMEMCKKV